MPAPEAGLELLPEPCPDSPAAPADWMGEALHHLSQPLTALECGLFIGTMSQDGVAAPTAQELLATILEALVQCERLTMQVRAMQDRLNTQS